MAITILRLAALPPAPLHEPGQREKKAKVRAKKRPAAAVAAGAGAAEERPPRRPRSDLSSASNAVREKANLSDPKDPARNSEHVRVKRMKQRERWIWQLAERGTGKAVVQITEGSASDGDKAIDVLRELYLAGYDSEQLGAVKLSKALLEV